MPRKRKKKIKPYYSVAELEKRASQFFPERRHNVGSLVTMIVDGTNLAYMAHYAYARLSHAGKNTAILYGVPSMLKSIMAQYHPKKLIICWDGEKDPKRMELLPGYKLHREKTREPRERKRFLKSIERLRVLLKAMGIPQAYNKALEGDDMIYWVTKKELPLSKILIVSGDKDLCQLINYDISIYNPRTRQPYTSWAYICDQKVEPSQYIDYLCLVGDKTDDIPGYRGIGEVRAAQFLSKYKSIKAYLKDSTAEYAGMSDKKALRKLWLRNREMIGLKRFNEKYHSMDDITYYKGKRFPKWNEEKFTQICLRYNMKTFLTDSFKAVFKKLQ